MPIPNAIALAAFDPSGNIWLANQGGSCCNPNSVTVFNPSTQTFVSGTSGYTAGGLSTPAAIAFNSAGNAWIANFAYRNNTLTELTPTGAAVTGSRFSGGGLNQPIDIAIDGAGNLWVANWGGSGYVSEFSSTGTAISPSNGFNLGNADMEQSVAIDSSGNVWTSDWTGHGSNNRCIGGGVTELVGAAAPTRNPISVVTPAGTTSTRP